MIRDRRDKQSKLHSRERMPQFLMLVSEVVQCLLETFSLLLVAPFVGSHGVAEILNGLIRLCMLFHQRRYLDG
ncbi:hypothetical protein ACHAWU_007717 [Discostella pseudostelligera]|uniref:Uncharacterized protein n=1 Tax=Discostella pseudostelligera TaxID=259834 RepID=A0ABD3M4A6_9STRA